MLKLNEDTCQLCITVKIDEIINDDISIRALQKFMIDELRRRANYLIERAEALSQAQESGFNFVSYDKE